jgi:hypothetical protein
MSNSAVAGGSGGVGDEGQVRTRPMCTLTVHFTHYTLTLQVRTCPMCTLIVPYTQFTLTVQVRTCPMCTLIVPYTQFTLTVQVRTCPMCTLANPASAFACQACGVDLVAAAAPGTVSTRPPLAYTPPGEGNTPASSTATSAASAASAAGSPVSVPSGSSASAGGLWGRMFSGAGGGTSVPSARARANRGGAGSGLLAGLLTEDSQPAGSTLDLSAEVRAGRGAGGGAAGPQGRDGLPSDTEDYNEL